MQMSSSSSTSSIELVPPPQTPPPPPASEPSRSSSLRHLPEPDDDMSLEFLSSTSSIELVPPPQTPPPPPSSEPSRSSSLRHLPEPDDDMSLEFLSSTSSIKLVPPPQTPPPPPSSEPSRSSSLRHLPEPDDDMSLEFLSSTSSIELVPPPQTPPPPPSSEPSRPSSLMHLLEPDNDMSLEFLSFLQSKEIIPIHKINDVIIPSLLRNMAKWDLSPLQAECERVCGNLSEIQENLEKLKEWEGRLNALTRTLILRVWEPVEEPQVAIWDIDETVLELRSFVSLPSKTVLAAKPSDNSQPSQTSSVATSSSDAFVKFRQDWNKLSHPQQRSLLYFSFFPENSVIRKKVPTYLWMGGYFLPSTVDWEENADQLFKHLIDNGFILPVEEKDIGDFNLCSLNPDIRSHLREIAQEQIGFLRFGPDGNPIANSETACMVKTKEGYQQYLSMISNPNKLRTLFNINENCLDVPPKRWMSKMIISVIHLGNWSRSSKNNYIEVESPDFLEYFRPAAKSLRCLCLNGISGITKLPDYITQSDKLNVLDLKFCRDLESLPSNIRRLQNLTHLDVSGCPLLERIPKGLAKLSELRVLKGFIFSPSTVDYVFHCTLGDLVKLKRLRKLSLYAHKDTTGENGELNCLAKFPSLTILTISWILPLPVPSVSMSSDRASPLVPSGLEKLDLRGWPLPTMPSWVNPREFNCLKKLYIRGGRLSCMNFSLPEQIGSRLSTVKILRLKFLTELRMDWNELCKLFPNLVYLENVKCPKLSSFPPEGVTKFQNECSEPVYSYAEEIWHPPPPGVIKLNTDGFFSEFNNRSGFGGIFRDSHGRWVLGYYGKVNCDCSLEVEIWAIYRGLTIILEKGMPNVIIESDSSVAVKLCTEGAPSNHPQHRIVEDARRLATRTNSTMLHISRQANQSADFLARLGSLQEEDLIDTDMIPLVALESVLAADMA